MFSQLPVSPACFKMLLLMGESLTEKEISWFVLGFCTSSFLVVTMRQLYSFPKKENENFR